jgi:hypothetical protein
MSGNNRREIDFDENPEAIEQAMKSVFRLRRLDPADFQGPTESDADIRAAINLSEFVGKILAVDF